MTLQVQTSVCPALALQRGPLRPIASASRCDRERRAPVGEPWAGTPLPGGRPARVCKACQAEGGGRGLTPRPARRTPGRRDAAFRPGRAMVTGLRALLSLSSCPCLCRPTAAPAPRDLLDDPGEVPEPLAQCAAWLATYFHEPAALPALPVPALHHPVFQQGQSLGASRPAPGEPGSSAATDVTAHVGVLHPPRGDGAGGGAPGGSPGPVASLPPPPSGIPAPPPGTRVLSSCSPAAVLP